MSIYNNFYEWKRHFSCCFVSFLPSRHSLPSLLLSSILYPSIANEIIMLNLIINKKKSNAKERRKKVESFSFCNEQALYYTYIIKSIIDFSTRKKECFPLLSPRTVPHSHPRCRNDESNAKCAIVSHNNHFAVSLWITKFIQTLFVACFSFIALLSLIYFSCIRLIWRCANELSWSHNM